MIQRVLALSLLVCIAVTAAGWHWNSSNRLSLAVSNANDTAMVVKMKPSTGLDSFVYFDSIDVGAAGASATRTRVAWTSPVQKLRIRVDSAKNSTKYKWTVTLGAAVNDSFTTGTGVTTATVVDSLVARIDAQTKSKDSIDAQDSVTYVLVVARFSQLHLGQRFALTSVDGGSGHYYTHVDTAWITTVESVCDSMAAKINATAVISDTVTGTSQDTVYTITADKKGESFRLIGASSGYTDSTQDSTTVQANVAGNSYRTDTIYLGKSFDNGFSAKSILGTFQLRSSPNTLRGFGSKDSSIISLYAIADTSGGRQWSLLSADTGTIPNTLRYVMCGEDSLGPDTILKDYLAVIVWILDSTSDTSMTATFDFNSVYTLKE